MSCKQILDERKHLAQTVRMYKHVCRRYILHTEHNITFKLAITRWVCASCVTVQQTDGVSNDNLSSLTEFLQKQHETRRTKNRLTRKQSSSVQQAEA